MDRILEFEYYEKNKLCSRCYFNYTTQEIMIENFVDDLVDRAFGLEKVTFDSIDDFFRERCFPETQYDSLGTCKALGLDYFDAEEICRITHGKCFEDHFGLSLLVRILSLNE